MPYNQARTPVDISSEGWWQTLKRVWRERDADHLGITSAGVAFYFFLAMIPLLAAMVLTYGLVVDPQEVSRHIAAITHMVPTDAANLIDDQLAAIVRDASGKKGVGLAVAIGLALYGAMQGAAAVMTGLNIAYERQETRGFLRQKLVAAGITLGAVAVAALAIGAAGVTAMLQDVANGLGPAGVYGLKIASWLAAATIASLGIAALYRYAPDRGGVPWVWVTPGTIMATLGLALATLGFGFYAANFGHYNATYGSLGAVVVLLLWLYISAYILLLGGELNGELEEQAADPSGKADHREAPRHYKRA